jgi:hypothetical protein
VLGIEDKAPLGISDGMSLGVGRRLLIVGSGVVGSVVGDELKPGLGLLRSLLGASEGTGDSTMG